MRTRRFGRTGLKMPVFSCGGMRYQHQWKDSTPDEIPPDNQANLEATIRRSLDLGINHIETARGYGTSEMQLGRILPSFPRDSLIVQTKVAPAASQEVFLKTFETSMAYLRLDYVDLLSIHGINNAELLRQTLDHALPAAEALRRSGRCRFIGFSTHADLPTILETIQTDAFDYVNLHWYFVNEINWPAIEAAHRLDMGVFIISPNDKGGKLYAPSPELREACRPLSPMMFNDLFCLSRPEVHTLSLGAARPSDFDEHVRALAFYDNIPAVLEPIERRLRAALLAAHGSHWCAAWREDLPEWERVPGGVNLQEILRLWMWATALNMTDFGKMRYNLLGNGSHWFPGNPASAASLNEIRPVLAPSPFADRIPDILAQADRLLADAPVQRLSQSD
ncbi:MAG: aldo/keto reductase [Candidatus Methylacidiphilales bacterium]